MQHIFLGQKQQQNFNHQKLTEAKIPQQRRHALYLSLLVQQLIVLILLYAFSHCAPTVLSNLSKTSQNSESAPSCTLTNDVCVMASVWYVCVCVLFVLMYLSNHMVNYSERPDFYNCCKIESAVIWESGVDFYTCLGCIWHVCGSSLQPDCLLCRHGQKDLPKVSSAWILLDAGL